MMRYSLSSSLATGIALLLLSPVGVARASQHGHPEHGTPQHEHPAPIQELKVGKSADVTFAREVRVGDATLKPGKYRLQHRVEGDEHFVRFEALATAAPSAQKTAAGVAVPAGRAGEVKCQLEPLPDKVEETKLHLLNEEGGQRLLKVLIRGENVAHMF